MNPMDGSRGVDCKISHSIKEHAQSSQKLTIPFNIPPVDAGILIHLAISDLLNLRLASKAFQQVVDRNEYWPKIIILKAYPKPANWSLPFYLSIDKLLLDAVKECAKGIKKKSEKKDQLSRVLKISLENIQTRICKISLSPMKDNETKDPCVYYRGISEKCMKEILKGSRIEVVKNVARQLADSLSQTQIDVPRLSDDHVKRWGSLIEKPSNEFEKWKKDSQVRDTFLFESKIYLIVDDPEKVDRHGFETLLFGEKISAQIIQHENEVKEGETILKKFLLSIRFDGVTLNDSKSITQLIKDVEEALSKRPHVEISQVETEALSGGSNSPHPGVSKLLFSYQELAPIFIQFLYQALNQYRMGFDLQKSLVHWIENRTVLEKFFSFLRIGDRGIRERKPADQTVFAWMDQVLGSCPAETVAVSPALFTLFLNRFNIPQTSMGSYLQGPFKEAYPTLYVFLCDVQDKLRNNPPSSQVQQCI